MTLAFALGVSASVRIEDGPDGSFTAFYVPDSPSAPAAHKRVARADGCSPCRNPCVRAIRAEAEFCSSFLAATYTDPADFAPVETQCAGDASRVSAACSCFSTPVRLPCQCRAARLRGLTLFRQH